MQKSKFWVSLLLVILISVGTVLPFFIQGFFSFHDDTQVPRVYLMWKAVSDGMFPVRWVQDLGYGYGYPIFNFYAPLPYYIGAVFYFLLGDALLATKAMFIFALIGSGVSMYLLAYRFLGYIPAIVAAVVYVYYPYHAVNMYVRGNASELYAYVIIPLFFLAWYGLYYAHKAHEYYRYTLLLALSFALIVISHNLSAYMTGLLASVLLLPSIYFVKQKKKFLISLISGGLLTLLLSASYWIPVVFEMQFTDVNSQVGGGSAVLDHFVCLNQFWNSPWGYTGSVPGCIDGMSFSIGKSNVLLAGVSLLLCVLYIRQKKQQYFLVYTAAICMLLSIFVITQYSAVVWTIIPGMDYLQFPWRFFNFFALFLSLIVGIGIFTLRTINIKLQVIGAVVVVLGTVWVNSRWFASQEVFPRDSAYYTNREYIGFEVTKRSDEYLPEGFLVLESSSEIPKSIIQPDEGLKVSEISNKTHYYSATVISDDKKEVVINIAYFPAWHAYINGEEVQINPQKRGFTLTVPEGKSSLVIKYEQTAIQKISNVLFFLGVAFVGVVILYSKKYGKK